MTVRRPALDECEPLWHDWDALCDLGAQQLHDPVQPGYWDLRH